MDGGGGVKGYCFKKQKLEFMKEVIFTTFGQKNLVLVNDRKDRKGLTRSAMFLFVFIIIHAVGNLHVFLGPDDFNGYETKAEFKVNVEAMKHLPQLVHEVTHAGRVDDLLSELMHLATQIEKPRGRLHRKEPRE
jgi:hypothetical protein